MVLTHVKLFPFRMRGSVTFVVQNPEGVLVRQIDKLHETCVKLLLLVISNCKCHLCYMFLKNNTNTLIVQLLVKKVLYGSLCHSLPFFFNFHFSITDLNDYFCLEIYLGALFCFMA